MIYLIGNPYDPLTLDAAHLLTKGDLGPVRAVWTVNAQRAAFKDPATRELMMELGGTSPLPPTAKVRSGSLAEVIAWTTTDIGTNNIAYLWLLPNEIIKPYQLPALGLYDAVVVRTKVEAEMLGEAGFAGDVHTEPLAEVVRRLVTGPPEPTVRVVIPVKNRPTKMLRELLESLKPQLRPYDEIVVSDLGSSKNKLREIHHLTSVMNLTLVYQRCGEWNIARARNNGMKAPGLPFDVVIPLDVDLIIPPDFVRQLRVPGSIAPAIPLRNGNPAPGAGAYPAKAVFEARGWDEAYEGWGSEDIDLLYRLGSEDPAGLLQKGVELGHHEHDAERPEWRTNQNRLADRIAGRLDNVVNPNGWGKGAKVYVERGRPRVAMRYYHTGDPSSAKAGQVPPKGVAQPPDGFGF